MDFHCFLAVVLFSLTVSTGLTEESNGNQDLKDGVKCPHLPCPLPPNCTHKAWSHFWYHGKLCKGCQFCTNETTDTFDTPDIQTSPACPPPLPCPPPMPECTRTKMMYQKYHGHLCPLCEMCIYWNISKPARQVHGECPMFKCPAPGPCQTELAYSEVHIPGVPAHCKGCPFCPTLSNILTKRQQMLVCPDVSCAEPGPCAVPYKVATLTVQGMDCPGCPYCPVAAGRH